MMMKKKFDSEEKQLNYYLSLPYKIEETRIPEEKGGGYEVCIPDLGRWTMVGDGETVEESIKNLNNLKMELFKEWLDKGLHIPEPFYLPNNKTENL